MTSTQIHTLQHALGADEYGRWPKGHDWYYRDYYVGQDSTCEELVELGFMTKHAGNCATGGDVCYRVTGNGVLAMRKESPKPPRLTRSQERYQRYLDWADAYGGTFRQFLQHETERS